MIAVATPVGHLVGLTGGQGPRHRRARRSRGLRRCAAFLIGVAVLLLAGCGPALARASDWARSPETDVRLVSAVAAVGDLPEIPLGLQFRMRPGWKIYWRSPGEGGYPPRPDWTGSENFGGASIAWPAPERFSILGIDSIGYAGEVVLPVT